MPIYPYSFTMPPVNKQDIPSDGVVGEFLGISAGGVLDWLPVSASGSGDMLKSENLSGLADYAIARTNIGLGLTSSPEFANLTLTSPSLASSAPVTISQTWNNAAVVFTGLKVNAAGTSDANSASGSLLADFQVNGVTKANIRKNGLIYSGFVFTSPIGFNISSNSDGSNQGAAFSLSGIAIPSGATIGFTSGNGSGFASPDTILLRDGAANTLALRNGDVGQTFNIYGTYTGAGANYARLGIYCAQNGNTTIATQANGTGVAGAFIFSPSNTERMRITSAGNVGIGTTAPGANLHIRNDQGAFTGIYVDNRSGAVGSYSGIALGTNTSGAHQWFLTRENTLTARLDIGLNLGSPFLSILSAGNVGIGTTAPLSKLQVNTNNNGLNIVTVFYNENNTPTGGNAVGFAFMNEGGNATHYKASIVHERTSTWARGKLHFLLNNTEGGAATNLTTDARMTIQPDGNVGIGTTSPTSKLHVAETWNNAGTAFCSIKSVITDTNSAAGSDFLELYSGTSTQPLRVDINKTGQINIYGAWTDSSNYERLSFSAPSAANAVIGTNKAGTGTARGLEFQTDGVTRMTLSADGVIASISSTNLNTGSQIRVGGLTRITNSSDGVLKITDSSEGSFNRLQLGGTTDAFPAIARDGAGIKFTGAAAGSTSWIKVPPVTVTSLPDATVAGVGARAFVNDALSPVFGNAVANGGSAKVPVYSDGSAWYVG